MKSYRGKMGHTRPVLVFGGGVYGEMAYTVLARIYNKSVEAIIDNKQREVAWADIPVIRSSQLNAYSGVDILICGANAFCNMVEEVEKYAGGDVEIYDCKELLMEYKFEKEAGNIDIESSYLYGSLNLDEMILKYNFYAGEDNGYDKKVYLSYCVLCITSKCSLKCKNCAAFITKYSEHTDYSLEYVETVFGKFLSAIDGIQELELMGGEPFLCSNFNQILKWCLGQEKICAVKIITNGTILPNQDTWALLKEDKVKLVIDDYGIVSKKMEQLIDLAKKHHVRYEIQKLQTWYGLEPVRKKGYSDREKEKIFHECIFRTCIGVTNGRLYHCNVSGHMNTVGLLSDQESDFIELEHKKWEVSQLKKEIKEFISVPYLRACDYCNYSAHIEVTVAEQG